MTARAQTVALVVCYCGVPKPGGGQYDLDGEGGMWSPGFVAAFSSAAGEDFPSAMRVEALRRLNDQYGGGWPSAGVPPITFKPEHFDDHDNYVEGGPFIQLQWETVTVEAPPTTTFMVGDHAEICTMKTGGPVVEAVGRFAIVALVEGGFFLIYGDPDSYSSGGACGPDDDEDAASEFPTLEAAREGLKVAAAAMGET